MKRPGGVQAGQKRRLLRIRKSDGTLDLMNNDNDHLDIRYEGQAAGRGRLDA